MNFFKINNKGAIPILERLAEQGDKIAGEMLAVARNADKEKSKKDSFMSKNPNLF